MKAVRTDLFGPEKVKKEMKKPELKKISPKKVWITIGFWVVLLGGGFGHILYNGTLFGAMDSNVEYISVADLELGKRPAARHIQMTGAMLDRQSINLSTRGQTTDEDYFYAVHDIQKGENSVVHIIIKSDNSRLHPEGTYVGHMGFPEKGFKVEEWLTNAFKEGKVQLADQVMLLEEGQTRVDDMLYAGFVIFLALVLLIPVTVIAFKDDLQEIKKQKANPLPDIPKVTQSREEILKEIAAIARAHAPEDTSESISFWANWHDIREPVTAQWDLGGTANPAPKPLLDALTKLEYYFHHAGDHNKTLLRFDMEYDEDKAKWSVTHYLDDDDNDDDDDDND
ncbi:MAG: hypothetical protein JXX14_05540 [Deltaproteobacteria bacterium]|nr:hypothetical protein [Deltaproteobacteria bacterium]